MTKILIVDDEARILLLLQSLLKANGFEAATARDGNQALELQKKTLSTSSSPTCACRRWME